MCSQIKPICNRADTAAVLVMMTVDDEEKEEIWGQ